jgi:hypothetical protein
MRHLTRCAVLAALLLALAGCQKSKGPGKNAGPVSIEQIRVGLPHGRTGKSALSRNGVWAPVYVTLKAGKDSIPAESYRLAVQTNDAEGSAYRYTSAVPAISPEEERIVVAYVQPGGPSSEFTPLLQRPNGDLVVTGPKVERKQERTEILEPIDQLVFSIGAQLTGLEQTLVAESAEKKDNGNANPPPNPANPNANANTGTVERGRRLFAFVEDDLSLLPDQWFGYEAADLVVLNTRQPTKFLDVDDDGGKRQRQALLEWVRRGGRVVLSVGKRHDRQVTNLLKQMPLINLDDIEGEFQDASGDLKDVTQWADAPANRISKPLEVAGVKLRGPTDPLRSPRVQVLLRDANERPLIIQTSCGLGRVLLVLFDLDSAPFAGWEAERAFWKKVLREMLPEPTVLQNPQKGFAEDRKPSLASDLQHGLEMFENIQPTNFGWVALFVLFYILLVGPLDYFILKKLFKRLELTWLTFPSVVIVVSVTAYLIAYSLKGDELRINKVDIVEFDLTDADRSEGQPRAYGRSWFTLFSPRIANFTVGIQPSVKEGNAPGWFPPVSDTERIHPPISWLHRDIPKDAAPAYPTTMALLAAPERSISREGETNLMPQAYDYADAAEGLERVPIPVWATRTFAASYVVPLDRKALPFQADLRFGSDGEPQGSITNNLPIGFLDVRILYNGQWYALDGDLPAESTRSIDQLFKQGGGRKFQQLFPKSGVADDFNNRPVGRQGPNGAPINGAMDERTTFYPLVRALFFYDLTNGTEEPNFGLRTLDQSWRVLPISPDNRIKTQIGDLPRRELLLIGKVLRVEGKAEELTRSPNSPTQVWLDHLPGTVAARPSLEGLLSQETYIRVYLPIRPREPSKK